MNNREQLEMHFEHLRSKMYNASESKLNYDKVIKTSRELDFLLNELEKLEEVNR